MSVETLATWKSPRSGGRYPSRWRLRVPAAGVDVELSPLLADQELQTGRSTGVTYWEGAVAGKGRAKEAPLAAEGYVELTGYAGALGGLF